MNEAYVLLNVDYQQQQNIIEQSKNIPIVKEVKSVYGICDILIIIESNDMHEIKNVIDTTLHNLKGITNITSLISVN